ncbi:MAG: head-tail joining protein [Stenotrophobium sp.]
MAIDWDSIVLGPVHALFGEAITYMPAAGAAFVIPDAVFDESFRAVSMADGIGMTSQVPVVGVRAAAFPTPPLQDDQLVIQRTGELMIVKEVQPDGHGWIALTLNYNGS